MLVYLAGPIDDIDIGEAKGWRERAKELLTTGEITVFDPATVVTYNRFDYPSEAKRVVKITEAAIGMSDTLLVNLAGAGRALGTIREIGQARSQGKRVVVWSGGVLPSFYASDLDVYYSLESACWALVEKTKICSNEPDLTRERFVHIRNELDEGVSYDLEASVTTSIEVEGKNLRIVRSEDPTHNIEILANAPTDAGEEWIDNLEQELREVMNTRVNEWHMAQSRTR